MKITTQLSSLRRSRGEQLGRRLTQREVAAATGIDRTTLIRIENGETNGIAFDTLVALCRYYDVDVGTILQIVPDSKTSEPSSLAA